MKGIFSKSGYSSSVHSILLGIAEDKSYADKLIEELKERFPGVLFFHEDIEVNDLSSRVMLFYG